MDKDLFLKEVFADAAAELDKYKSLARAITNNTSAEIAMLGKDADAVVDRVSKTLNNDDKVKEFLAKAKVEDAILDKIEKLSVLSSASIDRMVNQPVDAQADEAGAPDNNVAAIAYEPPKGPGFLPPPPRHKGPGHEEPIAPVNLLLDPSIPFAER